MDLGSVLCLLLLIGNDTLCDVELDVEIACNTANAGGLPGARNTVHAVVRDAWRDRVSNG